MPRTVTRIGIAQAISETSRVDYTTLVRYSVGDTNHYKYWAIIINTYGNIKECLHFNLVTQIY